MRGALLTLAICSAASGAATAQVPTVTLSCDVSGEGVYRVGGKVPLRGFSMIAELSTPKDIAESGRLRVKSLTDEPGSTHNGVPKQMSVALKVLHLCQNEGCETIVGDDLIVWGSATEGVQRFTGNLDRHTGVVTLSFSDASRDYIENFSGSCRRHSGERLF
jgi:hypothetical protein